MLDLLMIQLTNGWLKPPFELQRENFHYFGSFSSILREMLPLNLEGRGSLWAEHLFTVMVNVDDELLRQTPGYNGKHTATALAQCIRT